MEEIYKRAMVLARRHRTTFRTVNAALKAANHPRKFDSAGYILWKDEGSSEIIKVYLDEHMKAEREITLPSIQEFRDVAREMRTERNMFWGSL